MIIFLSFFFQIRYQECGCVDPYQWTARTVVLPGTNKTIEAMLCNATDTCFTNATDRVQNSDELWNEYCPDCEESCSTVDFTITPSAVSAPPYWERLSIKSFVENSRVPTPDTWNDTWISDIQNNYVALDVICQSTRIENYNEEASIGPVDVISNIGGNTGLWIGISFLSLMELVEMLYRLIRYHICLLRQRQFFNEHTPAEFDERL